MESIGGCLWNHAPEFTFGIRLEIPISRNVVGALVRSSSLLASGMRLQFAEG